MTKKWIIGQPDSESNRLKVYADELEAIKKCGERYQVVIAANEASAYYKYRNPYKSKAQKQ